jgi:hypothetical protein
MVMANKITTKWISLLYLLATTALITLSSLSQAATAVEILKKYESLSAPASSARGASFFTSNHGKEWSCSSCHDKVPNHDTHHIVTNKLITPLSPNFNAARFTNEAKVEKWFRRNCNDVLGRACTSQEKADVLSWLLTVR